MNDYLPATRIIRQLTICGSSVRVLSSNALFPLVNSPIILLELELSRELPRRYDMCFCLLIALCRFFLKKTNVTQIIIGALSASRRSGAFFYYFGVNVSTTVVSGYNPRAHSARQKDKTGSE